MTSGKTTQAVWCFNLHYHLDCSHAIENSEIENSDINKILPFASSYARLTY